VENRISAKLVKINGRTMLDGRNIKHKGLRKLWVDNDPSGLKGEWVDRAGRILQALDAAATPEELLGVPAYRLHPLKGSRKGTWSARVSKNYRITFKWADAGPFDVDLEDYHGRA
jgi:proteic killer suppression protein